MKRIKQEMTIIKPERIEDLTAERKETILRRSMQDISEIYLDVRDIVLDIQKRGDIVSIDHYRKFKEDIGPDDLVVTQEEIDKAYEALDDDLIDKLKAAAANIEKFHRAQVEREMWSMEIMEGVMAGRLTRPMDIIGAYLPGRKAVYPSSVLMTVIPARVAGVETVIACTPPSEGMLASHKFEEVTYGEVSDEERNKVRSDLEKYCSLDTEGMIWIVEKLKELCI